MRIGQIGRVARPHQRVQALCDGCDRVTDLVLWIQDGRVAEAGSPDALMAADGHYARALREARDAHGGESILPVSYGGSNGLLTEGATDASHASDLGFMRQADIFEPVLRTALGQ